MFKRVILEILRVFISFLWSILGIIFWIPFLSRMIATFTVSILLAVAKGNPMGNAEQGLEAGVTFYVDGFRKINESINNILNGTLGPTNKNHLDAKSYQSILIQLAYTLVFWAITLVSITYLIAPNKITSFFNTEETEVIKQGYNDSAKTIIEQPPNKSLNQDEP